jgi:hypothetical protein
VKNAVMYIRTATCMSQSQFRMLPRQSFPLKFSIKLMGKTALTCQQEGYSKAR